MEKSNLNNLMNRIQKDRDEMAFSEIFDFFAPKINAYFIQNRIKIESSEELTQEVLSTVWVKSNLYDSKKSALSTWIFTIARNKKIYEHVWTKIAQLTSSKKMRQKNK